MISIQHPEILQHIQDLDFGYMPFFNNSNNQWFLILKAPKEVILTARTNNEFKIYLVKDYDLPNNHLGLVSAFFDDHDEPLTMTTPVFSDDEMLKNICKVFEQSEFELYFFDEHNREIMGVLAKNENVTRYKKEIESAIFKPVKVPEILNVLNRMQKRFSIRDNKDDANAFTITVHERLYPDDIMIMDLREVFSGYNEDRKSIDTTSLERVEEPGPMQERGIALMIKRIFETHNIYVNPYRLDTGKELTDILVVGDEEIIFIQAKDSPNTEIALSRHIDRKRKTIRGHVEKAAKQLRGAISYAQNNKGLTIKTATDSLSIMVGDKQLIGIVVVKELFDDDYKECSKPVIEVMEDLQFPTLLTDYQQLHVLTQNLKGPDQFVGCIFNLVDTALTNGEYSKVIISNKIHPPQAT